MIPLPRPAPAFGACPHCARLPQDCPAPDACAACPCGFCEGQRREPEQPLRSGASISPGPTGLPGAVAAAVAGPGDAVSDLPDTLSPAAQAALDTATINGQRLLATELLPLIGAQIGYGRCLQIIKSAWFKHALKEGRGVDSAMFESRIVCVWCKTDERTGKKYRRAKK